jgi:radical SAM superfamily enzyme YgiQ (UPF0313 family)
MPTLRDEICFQDVIYTPFPIRLAQLAAVIRHRFAQHKLTVIDANADGLTLDELKEQLPSADLLIIQSAAGIIREDSQVCVAMKEKYPDCKTLMIETVVAPCFPKRFLNDFSAVDIVVQGQPEQIIPDIVASFGNLSAVRGIAHRTSAGIQVNQPAPVNIDLENMPFMAYDLFDLEKYSISMIDAPLHEKIIPGIRMRTTRDCPYGCPFCIIGSTPLRGYDRKWKAMSVKRVGDELEHVIKEYGVWGVFFWDETFSLDKKRTMAMCEEIIKRKLRFEWRCLTRIDCVDKDMLRAMYRAGCRQIEFGLEAGDPEVRKKLHKNFPDSQAISVIRETRKTGIRANVDMIVGMPWETKSSLQKTVSLAKKLSADNVHLTMAFPYPGTEFYDYAQKENLLMIDDIYDLMINQRVRIGAKSFVRTRELSSEQLEQGWKKVRADINRYYILNKIISEPGSFLRLITSCRTPAESMTLIKKAVRRLLRTLMMRTS